MSRGGMQSLLLAYYIRFMIRYSILFLAAEVVAHCGTVGVRTTGCGEAEVDSSQPSDRIGVVSFNYKGEKPG